MVTVRSGTVSKQEFQSHRHQTKWAKLALLEPGMSHKGWEAGPSHLWVCSTTGKTSALGSSLCLEMENAGTKGSRAHLRYY